MLLGLSYNQWGGILLLLGFIACWLRIFQRARAWAAGIGTLLLSGGLFTKTLVKGATALSHLTSALTGKLFGVGIPGALFIILGAVLIHDLHPRGGGASRRTFWLAIAVAACLVAGVSSFAQLNGLPATVRSGVSQIGG